MRRITRIAAEIARASASTEKTDVTLEPMPAYTAYWSSPVTKDPATVSTADKQAYVQKVVDPEAANKNVGSVTASVGVTYECRYFASTEGSYIEQETSRSRPR